MKKIFVVLLTLALCFTSVFPAFADETQESDCDCQDIVDNGTVKAGVRCSYCGGYTWQGTGCSGVPATSYGNKVCISHPNCTYTIYYFYDCTYCRDCGNPRTITSTHHHKDYHIYHDEVIYVCPW